MAALYLLRDDIARLPDRVGARYWAWRLDAGDRATKLGAIERLKDCETDGAERLLAVLKSSTDPAIRRAAAEALGSMKEQAPQVAEGLVLGDPEERFRNEAINLIVVIAASDKGALEQVVARLDDNVPRVSDSVVEVLSRSLPDEARAVLEAPKGGAASRDHVRRVRDVLERRWLLLR